MLESVFNKIAGIQAYNFIKGRFQHMCFPVEILKFLRTHILKNIWKKKKNICQQLLLAFQKQNMHMQ